jgi:TonB family protein
MLRRYSGWLALAIVVGIQGMAQKPPAGSLASAKPPVYPLAAEAQGIEGKVTLNAVIGTDGSLLDLVVVKGPLELRQAALQAVQQWKYHPYTKQGVPVAEKTTIDVQFKLGNKKQKAAAEAKARAELAKAEARSSQPSSAESTIGH